jgi:hypothetical protein
MIDFFKRVNMIPVVNRNIANNLTKDVFGNLSVKLKQCSSCLVFQPYSNFYFKAGKGNTHRDSIISRDLRSHCIRCYDYLNGTYNKGARPKYRPTRTLDDFICEEVNKDA